MQDAANNLKGSRTMTDLASNSVIKAAATDLAMTPVSQEQIAGGEPSTGTAELGTYRGFEVGVWEMTTGAMQDTEVDEVFVVIAGSATVEFLDGTPSLELGTGDIVTLTAGTQAKWTVHETLRKVYFA